MKKSIDGSFWIEREGNLCTVGLTPESLSFDSIEWIQLPEVGSLLQKGGPAVVIESCKAAIDIEAPLTGVVQKVNTALVGAKVSALTLDDLWLYSLVVDGFVNEA